MDQSDMTTADEIIPRPYHKDYEITDAMFAVMRTGGGFKFFAKLVVCAGLLIALLYILFGGPIIAGYMEMLSAMASLSEDQAADPEAVTEVFSGMSEIFLPALALSFASFGILAAVRTAFYRAYFDEDFGGIFPLRFKKPELRQLVISLGYYLLLIAFYIGAYIVLLIILGVLIGLAAAVGDGGGALVGVITGIVGVLGFLAMMAAIIYFLVGLSPAGALTYARDKRHLLAARHVTKNRFWALFGSQLVAFLIGYVAYSVISMIGLTTAMASLVDFSVLTESGEGVTDISGLIKSGPAAWIGGGFVALCIGFGSTFYYLMLMGPAAYFTKQWMDADPTQAFE